MLRRHYRFLLILIIIYSFMASIPDDRFPTWNNPVEEGKGKASRINREASVLFGLFDSAGDVDLAGIGAGCASGGIALVAVGIVAGGAAGRLGVGLYLRFRL